ncbi:MAG: beta-phosphoglucomutase [Sphingomonas sp.]|jgi:beta-phosphoglucomutase
MTRFRAAIFDLDGVLVDSARLHFVAWKRVADELGIAFDEVANEDLKGVDRMGSLDLILARGGVVLPLAERKAIAARKNDHYLEAVVGMTPADQLPGAAKLVADLRAAGLGCALASASRNAPLVLERVGLANAFDFIADPAVLAPKPAPDLFAAGATALGVPVADCIGFEDAAAGVAAIKSAEMRAIGIGDPAVLSAADLVFPSTDAVDLRAVLAD